MHYKIIKNHGILFPGKSKCKEVTSASSLWTRSPACVCVCLMGQGGAAGVGAGFGGGMKWSPSLQSGGWWSRWALSREGAGTVAELEHTCGRAAKEGGWKIKRKPENHRSPPICTSQLGLQCQAFERERLIFTRSRATDSGESVMDLIQPASLRPSTEHIPAQDTQVVPEAL